MRQNVSANVDSGVRTHEGAIARRITAEQQLRRSVMACLLWEDGFYEDGKSIAERIRETVSACEPETVARMAIEARSDYRMRHAPLLMARELARHPRAHGRIIGDCIAGVIQRADELGEFMALYDGRKLSAQVKRGLARAFRKFDAYQLAKYDRAGQWRLRDVLFMCHAKPRDDAQAAIWKQLVNGTLPAPDTWEVGLSGGGDKRETFERLLKERKLGYMALLRNVRNMAEAKVDEDLIFAALRDGAAKSKALPFRYLAAARAVPRWEREIDEAMQIALEAMDRLRGRTVVLVDVSYSMMYHLSKRSDLTRRDAACALAALVVGIAEDARVFSFSNDCVEVPPRRGMALIDAIGASQRNRGTLLGEALAQLNGQVDYDRIIVVTDEQSHDTVPGPKAKGYMINVAPYRNGVGYGAWTHIDGFSEAAVRYIQAVEEKEEGER